MGKYCDICPRECKVDRTEGQKGFCGCGEEARLSRVSLHMWEEPPISGSRGSGTIFFSGCSLRCVFCQNRDISRGECGRSFTVPQLACAMLRLQEVGAHNINLVTPTHYLNAVVAALESVKPRLDIPVVYNCGGYEKVESLKKLEGLVDVYLPDCKYISSELSERYSSAPDYFWFASGALLEMYRQTGRVSFAGKDGVPHSEEREGDIITRGLVIRHLVLPGCRKDSIALLTALAELLPVNDIRLSLMRQFTPDFVQKEKYPELCRRLTSFEYDSVLRAADELGFIGYIQSSESVGTGFTPPFNTDDAFEILDRGGDNV